MFNISIFDLYKYGISKDREEFNRISNEIGLQNDIEKKESLAKSLINFALNNSTGYYCSKVVEDVFLEIAKKHTIENLNESFEKDSFLHVMSESYKTGGHTRVVERWIELSPDTQHHSLVFTWNEDQEIPPRLINAVKNKSGQVINLKNNLSDLEKGLQLRELASHYEYVILHIHMNDIIPIIAFGNEQFQRPVIFFNHADHLFWVGGSIADIVADLRQFGQEITHRKRGIKKSQILSIPMDSKKIEQIDQKIARQKLGLPLDKKIILTVGSAYKYRPMGTIDLLDTIIPILKQDKSILFIGIGPTYKDLPRWATINQETEGRVIALGEVAHHKLHDYFFAADLVLDSLPLSGFTALIDAINCNKPVLTRPTSVGLMDYMKKSIAYCENQDVQIFKIFELLANKEKREENVKNVQACLCAESSPENWLIALQNLIATTPKKHSLSHDKIIIDENEELMDLDYYHFSSKYLRKRKKYIYIIKIIFIRIFHLKFYKKKTNLR
ncbi:MAG: hypothetical protein RR719_02795 [Akkermansia sp.]